jgi:hypothetical protein
MEIMNRIEKLPFELKNEIYKFYITDDASIMRKLILLHAQEYTHEVNYLMYEDDIDHYSFSTWYNNARFKQLCCKSKINKHGRYNKPFNPNTYKVK